VAVNGVEETNPGSRGRLIFILLLVLIGSIAVFYAAGSGPIGIEERFSQALGIAHDGEEPAPEEGAGFSLEGNPLLYAVVLILICVTCWAVYRKFGA
jgi:hypothetical protein